MPGMAVNSHTAIAATLTPVLQENSRRSWATFVNNSVSDMSLLMGDMGEDGDGRVLKANGGNYEINSTNFWAGPVYAICAAGPVDLSWTEVTGNARE